MNWYKTSQNIKKLDSRSLNTLEEQCFSCIDIINYLKKMFPNARFYSSSKQLDILLKEGPFITFVVFYNDIKERSDIHHIYFKGEPVRNKGVSIQGFIQSSGFDVFEYGPFNQKVPNLYFVAGEKFIPAEKTGIMLSTAILAESPDNLISLIGYNVIRKLNKYKIELKYKNNSIYNQIKEEVIKNDLEPEEGISLLKNNLNKITTDTNEKDILFSSFRDWIWDLQPKEKLRETLEKSISNIEEEDQLEEEKTGTNPYLFYTGMNPLKEGAGKFVQNIEDLETATIEWGDFSVLVRYQTGRMVYPASKIIEWNKSSADDDMAYNFFNQLGGIRDLTIIGRKTAGWYNKSIFKKAQVINILISIEEYRKTLWEELYNIVLSTEDYNNRISNFSYKEGELAQLLSMIDYPYKEYILKNDISPIEPKINSLFNWYLSLPYEKKTTDLRSIVRKIEEILEYLKVVKTGMPSRNFSESDAHKLLEEYSIQTTTNMNKIKYIIEERIRKIKQWNGSSILIEALEYDKENEIGPEDSARVYLGGKRGPMFSLFMIEERYEIDDIMDGAEDMEEFLGEKAKSDYFSLINILQNKEEKNKFLILYTARPIKDRNFYLTEQKIPSNIYLTDNYNRVSGIALELKGTEKYRDIWKLKISSEYVIVSYDGGNFKDYMAIGDKTIPVEWIKLISPGELN